MRTDMVPIMDPFQVSSHWISGYRDPGSVNEPMISGPRTPDLMISGSGSQDLRDPRIHDIMISTL